MKRDKITYDSMLELLKKHEYEAPNSWNSIAESLDLSQELKELPQYTAPDNLWGGIEKALDNTEIEATLDTSTDYKKYLIGAGLIIIFLSLVIAYLLLTRTTADSEFSYRSETEAIALSENSALPIDENLDEVLMYIQANEFIFSAEELDKFERHLAELKSAIKSIQEMKENYGQDESINRLLARIERDKSNLLKEMIAATS